MQRLSVGSTNLLIDDDSARAIVWYTVQLSKAHRTECIEVEGYDDAEQPVTAQFVLGPGTTVTSLTVDSSLDDPVNDKVRDRIRDDTDRLENPPHAEPDQPVERVPYEDLI